MDITPEFVILAQLDSRVVLLEDQLQGLLMQLHLQSVTQREINQKIQEELEKLQEVVRKLSVQVYQLGKGV